MRLESKQGDFVEVELSEATFTQCRGRGLAADKPKSRTYDDEDAARYAMARLVARLVRDGYWLAGASRVLPPGSSSLDEEAPALPESPSSLLLDEWFAAADDRFLGEVCASHAAHRLGALAERWFRDERPWARRMLLAYIDDGCDRAGHKALVKRLYKLAEAAGDDEAMAHFLAAFDRLSRRLLISRSRSAYREGRWTFVAGKELVQDPSVVGRLVVPGGGKPRENPQFSRATRRYLMRRAHRYFRLLGHRDLARYRAAMTAALPLYRERALTTPSRLLDSWGLLHTLYAGSPVLARQPRGLRLAEGKSLGELEPAPLYPAAWQGEAGFAALLVLVATGKSRTVRGWALALLRRDHREALAALPLAEVQRLLLAEPEEAQKLGAELLKSVRGLELMPVGDWLELLAIEQLDVLAEVARLAERTLHPDRLSLAQCLELARAKPGAVAMLGVTWLQRKPIVSAAELSAIVGLAKIGAANARAAAARWVLERLAAHPLTSLEHVRELGDAPHRDVRELVLAALTAGPSEVAGEAASAAGGGANLGARAAPSGLARFGGEPSLWFAFAESPYDDVRAAVLERITRWRREAPPQALRHLWATALLAVHRGSAAKAKVPRQIAERLVSHPEEAEQLLPVLGLALRSVRPAERALAMGALARAVRGSAALAARALAILPELSISEQVVQ